MQRILIDSPRISVFNANGMEKTEAGWSLARVPAAWRARFPEATASRAMQVGGVEIRFRTDSRRIGLEGTFRTQAGDPMVVDLYYGRNWVGTKLTEDLGRERTFLLWEGASPGTEDAWRVMFHPCSTVDLRYVLVEEGATTESVPALCDGPRILVHGGFDHAWNAGFPTRADVCGAVGLSP